ncbi:MAG: class I SAM-dependent methyltransferase [Candidatus Omnitrophica bacterium]|nr:class I SAM-dependent methyltransferase [Candidatus Omnitrophota bacterium]
MGKILRFFVKYGAALIASVYLFTIGFFKSRNRDLISAIAAHFGFGKTRMNKQPQTLPQVTAQELIPESPAVRLKEPSWADGNVSLQELIVINQLVRKHRPNCVFEMGTFDGRTTLNMALNLEEGGRIFTLDLPSEEISKVSLPIDSGDSKHILKPESGARFKGRVEGSQITQLFGDTARFDFSPYEGRVDFVFIDAAHSLEYVLNDSRIALKLLKGGKGVILWHDYGTFDGVTEALNRLSTEPGPFRGVRRIRETSLAYLSLD